jgi:hypothetical protein
MANLTAINTFPKDQQAVRRPEVQRSVRNANMAPCTPD